MSVCRRLDATLGHGHCLLGQIEHPILLTEGACNPLSSRNRMAELLFETYGVPSLGKFFLLDLMMQVVFFPFLHTSQVLFIMLMHQLEF